MFWRLTSSKCCFLDAVSTTAKTRTREWKHNYSAAFRCVVNTSCTSCWHWQCHFFLTCFFWLLFFFFFCSHRCKLGNREAKRWCVPKLFLQLTGLIHTKLEISLFPTMPRRTVSAYNALYLNLGSIRHRPPLARKYLKQLLENLQRDSSTLVWDPLLCFEHLNTLSLLQLCDIKWFITSNKKIHVYDPVVGREMCPLHYIKCWSNTGHYLKLLLPQRLHAGAWNLRKKKNTQKKYPLVLLETVRSSFSHV